MEAELIRHVREITIQLRKLSGLLTIKNVLLCPCEHRRKYNIHLTARKTKDHDKRKFHLFKKNRKRTTLVTHDYSSN